MTVLIAGVPIGAGHPCRVVAELSNAHNGSLKRAHRLIDAAKEAGADFLKFQCYTPRELVALRGAGPAPDPWGAHGWTMLDLYEKAQTPLDWFPALVAHCRDIGLPWFSSVFGAMSFARLEALDCPAYKIARLDNQSAELRAMVRATKKPVIVSNGGEPDGPVGKRELRLWCPAGYAQPEPGMFTGLTGRVYDGFSYHGTDPLPGIIAATLGAHLVEAHFQLDDEPSELEATVSLGQRSFRAMVDGIRRMEAMTTVPEAAS